MSPLSLDEMLIHEVSLRQEDGKCKERGVSYFEEEKNR
jgi:hypothetical protein